MDPPGVRGKMRAADADRDRATLWATRAAGAAIPVVVQAKQLKARVAQR
jgi:hypothetical protein